MRARLTRWVLLALAVVSAATTSAALAQAPGAIAGVVADSAGAGIAGICVAAYDDLGPIQDITTAADGTYTLADLGAGAYKVWAQDCGRLEWTQSWFDGKTSITEADLVTVVAGATTSGIDLVLLGTATVEGTVTDTAADPLQGICVFAQGPRIGWGLQTGSNGTFRITGLEPGEHTVSFTDCVGNVLAPQWWSGKPSAETADVITLAEGEVRTGIDAVMSSAASPALVAGTVTNGDTSAPVVAGCVSAWLTDIEQLGSTTTAGDGTYELSLTAETHSAEVKLRFEDCTAGALAPEWHRNALDFSSAAAVTVVKGATTVVDASLHAPATVGGMVTDTNDTPIADACVVFATGLDAAALSAVAATGADGTFEAVVPLPAGPANHLVVAAGCVDGTFLPHVVDSALRLLPGEVAPAQHPVLAGGEGAWTFTGEGTFVTTDLEGDGTTGADPFEASFAAGTTGVILLGEEAAAELLQDGLAFPPWAAVVTAPPLPLMQVNPAHSLTLQVDASLLPPAIEQIQVTQNGAAVSECLGSDGVIGGACVAWWSVDEEGDLLVQVLTASASTWRVGVRPAQAAATTTTATTTTTGTATTSGPPATGTGAATTNAQPTLPATGAPGGTAAGAALALFLFGAALTALGRARGADES